MYERSFIGARYIDVDMRRPNPRMSGVWSSKPRVEARGPSPRRRWRMRRCWCRCSAVEWQRRGRSFSRCACPQCSRRTCFPLTHVVGAATSCASSPRAAAGARASERFIATACGGGDERSSSMCAKCKQLANPMLASCSRKYLARKYINSQFATTTPLCIWLDLERDGEDDPMSKNGRSYRTNATEAHIEDSRTTNWREALLLVLCRLLLEVSDMYPVRSFL